MLSRLSLSVGAVASCPGSLDPSQGLQGPGWPCEAGADLLNVHPPSWVPWGQPVITRLLCLLRNATGLCWHQRTLWARPLPLPLVSREGGVAVLTQDPSTGSLGCEEQLPVTSGLAIPGRQLDSAERWLRCHLYSHPGAQVPKSHCDQEKTRARAGLAGPMARLADTKSHWRPGVGRACRCLHQACPRGHCV